MIEFHINRKENIMSEVNLTFLIISLWLSEIISDIILSQPKLKWPQTYYWDPSYQFVEYTGSIFMVYALVYMNN